MRLGADDAEGQARLAAFLQGLQELGWTEGRNLRIDYALGGRPTSSAIADIAAELVALDTGHPYDCWRYRLSGFAKRDPHSADRVHYVSGPGRERPGREFGAAGRQCHRLYVSPNMASAGNGWNCSKRSRRA